MAERMAPDDTEVQVRGPVENIDAPRSATYAPIEFGGEIQEYDRSNRYLSEIPKSLANIVIDVDDTRRSIKAEREKTDIVITGIENAYQQMEEDRFLKLYNDNNISEFQKSTLLSVRERQEQELSKIDGNPLAGTEEVLNSEDIKIL